MKYAPGRPPPWVGDERRRLVVKDLGPVVEDVEGRTSRVGLAPVLGHRPLPRRAIEGDGRPSSTVLVTEMDQQRMGVVFDPQTMPRIGLFVQTPDGPAVGVVRRDEGCPPPTAPSRRSAWPVLRY